MEDLDYGQTRLLNYTIEFLFLDKQFSVNSIIAGLNAKGLITTNYTKNDYVVIINFLINNDFVNTGIFSQLQREEGEEQAILKLTRKGIELKKAGTYQKYLFIEFNKRQSNEREKLKSTVTLIATIISAVAAIVAAVESIIK